MKNRNQYLNGECSFDEYYRGIAAHAGLRYSKDHPLVKEAAALLAGGVERNLNAIALARWDRLSVPPTRFEIGAAFRAAGDYATAAGLVCLHKQAVLDAIDGKTPSRHSVRISFNDGDTLETEINGTRDEVLDYYHIGKQFNLGNGPDDRLALVVSVEFIE